MREQYLDALAIANRKRSAAAAAKRKLRAGEISLAEVFADPDCDREMVYRVLHAQYKWGPQRVQMLMQHFGIGQRRRVCDLTDRQIGLLVEAAQLPQSQWWTLQRSLAA